MRYHESIDDEDDDFDRRPSAFSALGVLSFAAVLVSGFALFVLFILAGILENSREGGIDENSPEAMVLGLALFAGLGGDLLGIGLGIGGLCQPGKSKLLSGLGVGFGVAILLGTFFLILLGLLMG
jgi:hypothetical protein